MSTELVDSGGRRPEDVPPMGRWESFRTGGWTGRPLARKPVAVSVDALRRSIRGDRRRSAAQRRVDEWREELSAKDRITLEELEHLLVLVDPEAAPGASAPIFLDIELDASGQIKQVGVAVRLEGEIVVAEGTAADVQWLSSVTAGRAVVAHNGAEHDFPRLVAAGVCLPPVRLDSLRWSWIAWPTLTSHAVGALLEHLDLTGAVPPLELHDAVSDAHALVLIWSALATEINGITPSMRSMLHSALASVEDDSALDLVLGPIGDAGVMPRPEWSPDQGAPASLNRVRSRSLALVEREGAARVVVSLREALAALPQSGLLLRPSQVLDPTKVDRLGPGWPKALALRVLDCARGAIPLSPPSARRLLADLGWAGQHPLHSPGTPMLTDLTTVSLLPVERPITLDVGLAPLFEPVDTGVTLPDLAVDDEAATMLTFGELTSNQRAEVVEQLKSVAPPELADLVELDPTAGVLLRSDEGGFAWMVNAMDPGGHRHGIDLVLDGPVGATRSRVLWERLLGQEVEVHGPASQTIEWSTIDGLVGSSARHLGHRTVQLLGIAAAHEERGQRTLVVDAAAPRGTVEPVATRAWTVSLGRFLLRPPAWPTVDEARRRLVSGSARTALVGASAARTLVDIVDSTLLARQPVPSSCHPTVERLVGADPDDPFTSIIEPLAAHLAAAVIAAGKHGSVAIADPMLTTGVLADLCGTPVTRHLSEYPSRSDVVNALLSELTAAARRGRVSERAVAAALRRLLPPGAEAKPFQQVVIQDVTAGKDVIAVFRTGLGKSLCYQAPALALAEVDGVTIVISPLIALQRDQLRGLRQKGVAEAAVYNSSLTQSVRDGVLRGIRAGFYRLIFVSPEALSGHALRRTLQDVDVALIAIDEAHCISEMGHEFRPDYRTLPRSISRLIGLPDHTPRPSDGSGPTIVALTGTASPQVIDDIKALLS
jgi:hypothetical protein